MDNEELEQQPQPEEYVPRPRWQVWLAQLALVVFIAFLIMYSVNILRS